jgi:Fibronectin type III domain
MYAVRLIPPPKPTAHVTSDSSVMLRWTALANEVLFVKVQYKRIGKRRVDSGWKTVDEDLPSTKQSFEVSGLQAGACVDIY